MKGMWGWERSRSLDPLIPIPTSPSSPYLPSYTVEESPFTPMLKLGFSSTSRQCDGVSRRDFLKVGALSVLGLTLPDLLRIEAAQAAGAVPGGKRAKSVLLIYLGGGLTHHDSLDPKPDAP